MTINHETNAIDINQSYGMNLTLTLGRRAKEPLSYAPWYAEMSSAIASQVFAQRQAAWQDMQDIDERPPQ